MKQLRERLYLLKEYEHLKVWHRVIGLWVFLFIVWGLYRLIFKFPVWFEEIVLKALVFGGPIYVLTFKREKRSLASLGMTMQNLFLAVSMGFGVGSIFWVVGQLGNFIRHGGQLNLTDFGLSMGNVGAFLLLAMVTAFWEELVFMGYILQRLMEVVKDEWNAAMITGSLFAMIHLPAIIVGDTPLVQAGLQLLLLLSLGIGNSVLMLRTKNLMAPILVHTLWGLTVYLFR